jgi:hypothetical protein
VGDDAYRNKDHRWRQEVTGRRRSTRRCFGGGAAARPTTAYRWVRLLRQPVHMRDPGQPAPDTGHRQPGGGDGGDVPPDRLRRGRQRAEAALPAPCLHDRRLVAQPGHYLEARTSVHAEPSPCTRDSTGRSTTYPAAAGSRLRVPDRHFALPSRLPARFQQVRQHFGGFQRRQRTAAVTKTSKMLPIGSRRGARRPASICIPSCQPSLRERAAHQRFKRPSAAYCAAG